jgi:hypothetical protein
MSLHPIEKMTRLNYVRVWSDGVLRQVDRVEAAYAAMVAADDQRYEHLDAVYFDEHLLFVAVNQLITALGQSRMQSEIKMSPLPADLSQVTQHLRDFYEHWEHTVPAFERGFPDGRDQEDLAELHKHAPEAMPFMFPRKVDGDLVLAGGVNLRDLRLKVEKVQQAARSAYRKADEELDL